MRPDNEFTSPEHRFFYPVNYAVEHHESLDTENLPSVEHIVGQDHYAIVETVASKSYGVSESYGAMLFMPNFNIPSGTTIKRIQGFDSKASDMRKLRPFVSEEDFDIFDDDAIYTPQTGTSLIVQADMSRLDAHQIDDPRFDDKGIAIIPQTESLPKFEGKGLFSENTRYNLLGFIDENDKLITWEWPTSNTALLVDWSVANSLKQNRLESALLNDTLPFGGHLVGMLSGAAAASTYLRYYDAKHGTSFMPVKDPRDIHLPEQFPPLSDREFALYKGLADKANHFMTNRR